MRIAVTVPQFREHAGPAVDVARAAEDGGLDGIFVFDHLWPIGRPERPALASLPLLGALAVHTERVVVGTLVARIGLLPNAVLANALLTVAGVCDGRLVAGIGTGDRLSRAENEAYGVPFAPAAERLADVSDCVRRLRAADVAVWVGGRSAAVRALAAREGVPLNLWGVTAEEVARAATAGVEVTWGGEVGANASEVAVALEELRGAGAGWAVCAPRYGAEPAVAVAAVVEAKQLIG